MLINLFNLSNPGKGMEKLVNDGKNLLILVKSTDAITVSYVVKEAKNRANKLTASAGKTVLPSITSQVEAQEEAIQLNVINQLVISTKEGVVKAITKLVGSDVTNAILRMANSSDHKSIDNFTLFKVMKLAIDGADQPSTNDVLEQLLEIINHNFDSLQEDQHQHGADAIKRGTNGHTWYHHWYPTAHADAVGQHQDRCQI